jgi:cell division protein FtsL
MARSMHANARQGPRTERNRAVPRLRRRAREVVAFYVLGLCLMGLALFHVWLRFRVVHMGYVLSSASKLQHQIEHENRELKVELATLTSPDRLEAMARRRLGLRPPEKGQVIILP